MHPHDDAERAAMVAAGRETIAEFRRAADDAVAAVVRVVEAETGVTLAVRPPSIMDATREQLNEAAYRAGHALEAMKLIRGWFWPKDVESLGEFVRELPEDVREQIADHLVKAGLS